MSAPGVGRVRSRLLRLWCDHAALPYAPAGERATCPRCKQECVALRAWNDTYEHYVECIEWRRVRHA